MKIRLRENFLDKKYLLYFEKNNIIINNTTFIAEGENSKTYKIETNNKNYALNIRDNEDGRKRAYLKIKGNDIFDYLPLVYSVDTLEDYYAVVMEFLSPISEEDKKSISCIDYLFYANNEDGLDIWLEDNLYESLYIKVISLINKIKINKIKEKKYTEKLKWFYKEYPNYKNLIYSIQSAFQEYRNFFQFSYTDFHGDNLMKNENGNYKLIDI